MSVWPSAIAGSVLAGNEGELVSVSLHADPHDLEALLEALAQVEFPINPQIYHDAALVYYHADGSERVEPVTLVEFPAYSGNLDALRRVLGANGFDPAIAAASPMLDTLHDGERREPAPPGAPYRERTRRRHAGIVRATPLQ